MAARVVLRPEAARDIGSISGWYEARRQPLGEDFLLAMDECFDALSRNPEMCAGSFESFRRYVMRRFPHVVFYEYADGVVTVYGVFHAARDPRAWQDRLTGA